MTESIVIDTMPPPPSVWERTWESGHVTHYQGLYKIYGPGSRQERRQIGVRITVQVDRTYPDKQSYAVAEVFSGGTWNAVSGLPPQLMKCIEQPYGYAAKFSLEGLAKDVCTLLTDTQYAWDYRVRSDDSFYVWTTEGRLLKVDGAPDANAAMREIREGGQFGTPVQVLDEDQWRDYNRVPKHICRWCGEPKNLCGGWCQIPEASW